MLKVGRKRKRKEKKERANAHKLDCQDSSLRFSVSCSCWLRVPEPSPRSQESKTRSIFEYFIRNNHATHRLTERSTSHTVSNANKIKNNLDQNKPRANGCSNFRSRDLNLGKAFLNSIWRTMWRCFQK